MTKQEVDSTVFDDTITTGSNETMTVSTSRADDVLILIDDGTAGGAPPQYTMTQRVKFDEIDEFQFYDDVTGETSRSWVDPAWGNQMEFEFNNTSGADAAYRIVIKAYRTMD